MQFHGLNFIPSGSYGEMVTLASSLADRPETYTIAGSMAARTPTQTIQSAAQSTPRMTRVYTPKSPTPQIQPEPTQKRKPLGSEAAAQADKAAKLLKKKSKKEASSASASSVAPTSDESAAYDESDAESTGTDWKLIIGGVVGLGLLGGFGYYLIRRRS